MAHYVPPKERGVVSDDTTPRYTLAELADMLQRLAAEDERRRCTGFAPPSGPNSLRQESRGSDRADSSANDPGDRRYWDNVSPDSSFLNAHLPSILPEPSLVPGAPAQRQERSLDEKEDGRTEPDSNSGTYYSSRASSPDDDSPFTSAPLPPSARYGPSSTNPYRSLYPTSAPSTMPCAPSSTAIPPRATPANNPAYTLSWSNPFASPAIVSSTGMHHSSTSFPDPPSPATPSLHVEGKGKARVSSSVATHPARLSTSGTRPEPGALSSASRQFVAVPSRLSTVSSSDAASAEAASPAAPARLTPAAPAR
ncbi:uncharacterized protein TRAVEDRAFT_52909, partial [Trametes versicolor FP-101664 SS1]|uniref:uncharacterized protein n=1 Tax=Trametes versicolor (strain FP-101664) TaxID=717944 RepID=UPI0004623C00